MTSFYDVMTDFGIFDNLVQNCGHNNNGTIKTGSYVKASGLSFQNLKTELKNLF